MVPVELLFLSVVVAFVAVVTVSAVDVVSDNDFVVNGDKVVKIKSFSSVT